MFPKKFTVLFSLLLISTLLLQCTDTVEDTTSDETAHASFYVRYLADALQLKGQASFLTPDSTSLKIPTGVAFMGSGTRERELPGQVTRYESTMEAAYPPDLRFTFRLPDSDKQSSINLPMQGIQGFDVIEATKSGGLTLSLNGNLEDGETLLLLFTDSNQEARTILRPGPLSTERLLIPSDALLHFTPGEYRLYLVKQAEKEGQEQGLSYTFSAEYYTTEKAFTLEE